MVVPCWVLVAVATAVADDAVVAGADAALLAALDGEPAAVFEPDPPHAASSSTNAPSPVAAANPLLRITSLQFARMTLPREPSGPGSAGTSDARRSAGAADDVALGHLDHVPHAADAI